MFKRDLGAFLREGTNLDDDEIDDMVLFVGAHVLVPKTIRRPAADRIVHEAAVKIRDLVRSDGDRANDN
jgi:hypothetical protein